MKKLLAMSMALIMLAGLTGCGKEGFSSKNKKLIAAAESVFDAEELGSKEKKQLIKNSLRFDQGAFADGIYVTLEADEMEKIKPEKKADTGYEPEDVKNMTLIGKEEGKSMVNVVLMELKEKDKAESLYKYLLKNIKNVKKQLKNEDDVEYNTEEDDNKSSLIAVGGGHAAGYYLSISGKVVTMVSYTGDEDTDLLEEFYDFMREAKLTDLEELLEDA